MQPTHNSIGGLCPLIIYGAGIDPTRFGVMNGVTGEDTGPIFENYNAAAHAAAHTNFVAQAIAADAAEWSKDA